MYTGILTALKKKKKNKTQNIFFREMKQRTF